MNCEMCGKKTEKLFLATIEGVELRVCNTCAKFGTVKRSLQPQQKQKTIQRRFKPREKQERKEPLEIIVPNYAQLIKQAREKAGLKQEELAKKINEKESLIHHIESGKTEPSIAVARKLERFFGLTLIEQVADNDKLPIQEQNKDGPLTIGDIITIKKRK